MIYIEPGLYLRVQQLAQRPPHPLPLDSGFSSNVAYRALGVHSPSETSECYFMLANDRDETWFISNRHFRVVGLFPQRKDLRFELSVAPIPRVVGRPLTGVPIAHRAVQSPSGGRNERTGQRTFVSNAGNRIGRGGSL